MGLNEDEPQLMSLVKEQFRSRRVPSAWTKADVCAAKIASPRSLRRGRRGKHAGKASLIRWEVCVDE